MIFIVNDRQVSIAENKKIIGDNADYKIEVIFDEEWKGKVKTARFIRNNTYMDVLLEDDSCTIPVELLKKGTIKIGFFSAGLATTTVSLTVSPSILDEEGRPKPISLDIYEQIMKKIENMEAGEVTTEQIEAAVLQYLADNPVQGMTEADVKGVILAYMEENPIEAGEISTEQIKTAVDGYMSENPVQGMDETEVQKIIADYMAENPDKAEGLTVEQIEAAVNMYLKENPVEANQPQVTFYTEKQYTCYPDQSFDIYFDNVITANCSLNDIYFTVYGDTIKGNLTVNDDRLTIKANVNDTGLKKFTVTAKYLPTGATIGSTQITYKVLQKASLANEVKMIFLGDSLTDQNTFSKRVQQMIGSKLLTYGTRGTAPYLHEGRTSWTTAHYLQTASYNTFQNPFYNAEKSGSDKFDFAYYIQNHQNYKDVQIVNVFLGRNDGYNLDAVKNLRKIVDNIMEYNNEIIITMVMSYHLGYAGKRTYAQKNTVFDFNAALHEEFKNDENVVLVPSFVSIDGFYDHPHATKQVSDINTETKTIVTDKVHLNTFGYYKIADVLTTYLKDIFATKTLTTKYKAEETLDKTELSSKIAEANTNLNNTTVSADGADVATTKKWVTQNMYDAFQTAIETAQAEYDSTESTIESVAGAISALAEATTVFDNEKESGLLSVSNEYTYTDGTRTCDISNISTSGTSALVGKYADVFWDSSTNQYVAFVTDKGFGYMVMNGGKTYLRYDYNQSEYVAGYLKTSSDGYTWGGYAGVSATKQYEYGAELTRLGEQKQY